ncbi:MAG: putative metal-binding motif-containing protein, partial [Myxococcales bacterium]|nr:putative metal-binding motif-containing protein [Myxococcales bacterium]
ASMHPHWRSMWPVAIFVALGLGGCPSPTEPETTAPVDETGGPTPSRTPSAPPPTAGPESTPSATMGLLPPDGPCPDDSRDYDHDGVACSRDCNERDPSINPLAAEACDGIDNDCDTKVDEGFPADCYAGDADGDGVSPAEGDCDDTDPDVAPGKPERCDGLDTNCDGTIDNVDGPVILYPDADDDGCGTAQGQFTFTRCDLDHVSWQACDATTPDA